MPRLLSLAALLAVSAGLAAPALAAPPRVGVVVSLAVNVGEDESTALAVALGDALRQQLVVDPVAGNAVNRRLPAGGVPEDCVTDAACIRDLGSRLEADQLLLLVVARVGTRVQIDATWADVASGRTVSREALQVEDGGAPLAEVFRDAALRLLPEATVRAAGAVGPVEGLEPEGPGLLGPPDGPVDRPATGRRFTTGFFIAGGIGAAALLGGAGLALAARSDYNTLRDGCGATRTCPDEDVDTMERKALFADLLFGTALAAGATAAFFYYTSGGEAPAVQVSGSPDAVTLSWGGRF